ncbi:MAG TPA: hypothetical protein VK325_04395 [Pseudoxanthomonas sp.]|nr:hypothetical protein [Pseudoxanthomonas sp.]
MSICIGKPATSAWSSPAFSWTKIDSPSSCRIAPRAAGASFVLLASLAATSRHTSRLGQELRWLEAAQSDQLRAPLLEYGEDGDC